MKKEMDSIRMGFNLGFIQKIVLIDGTVIDNMQVLYRAPIPSKTQLEELFKIFNRDTSHLFAEASCSWSIANFIPHTKDF